MSGAAAQDSDGSAEEMEREEERGSRSSVEWAHGAAGQKSRSPGRLSVLVYGLWCW